MKKILILLSIVSLAVVSSCGSDDEVTDQLMVNELFFDGTSLVGENGISVDNGPSGDHYEHAFAISDGDINYNQSSGSFQFLTSSKFILSFGAASLGNSQFSAGVFEFRPLASSVPDTNYFFDATFIDIDNSSTLSVTSGTLTVSGESPNWSLGLDLTLTGGKKVTGAFIGTFEVL